MKTVKAYLILIALFFMSSCVEEIHDSGYEMQETIFSATYDAQTRTALSNGTDVYWLPGDQIAVYGAEEPFNCTATEPTPFTSFYGEVSEMPTYYACYPQAMHNNWTYAPYVVMILPTTQIAVKGSFANELNAAVAYADADDMTFRFKNVLGYVKFTIPSNIKSLVSVKVETINGEQLSGSFSADCSSDTPTGLTMPNATPFVQLVGSPLISEGSYYMALLPGTYAGGLKFTFKNSSGQLAVKTIKKELTLSAGQIRNIGMIDNLTFKESASSPVPPNNEIWYVTSDGSIAAPKTPDAFGAKIISNVYKNGLGVIKFDGDVTMIGEKAYWYCDKADVLTDVYVPETVTVIGDFAFCGCTALKEFTIPSQVTKVGYSAFNSPWAGGVQRIVNRSKKLVEVGEGAFKSDNLCEFVGELVSPDGRCLVVDGELIAFAKGGLTEYSVPVGITSIAADVFNDCNKLKKISLPDGLLKIGDNAFYQCNQMTEINIPETVEEIGEYAFTFCVKLRGISFPERLEVLPEGVCECCDELERVYLGNNLKSIGSYAFYECISLESITIPESVQTIGDSALGYCHMLGEIKGKFVSGDNRSLIVNNVLKAVAPYGLVEYTIPDGVKVIAPSVFVGNQGLTAVTIPEGVEKIGMSAFNGCGLTSLRLPSTLKYIENFIFKNNKLGEVYCYAETPPGRSGSWYNVAPFDEGVIIRVPEQSVQSYKDAIVWNMYRVMDLDEEIYLSSDFSKDGEVNILQKATKGNGVDIVFMGDGYSDRQIAAGSYSNDVSKAMEMLFAEEPYHSMRDMFNVYQVTAVSSCEGYGVGATAFGGYFGTGTLVGGNNSKVIEYALKAVSSVRLDEAVVIVMMNREYYAGTCYMYYPAVGGYGNGLSISYFPLGTDDEMLAGLILHEAGGHGFSKLGDEYSYEYMGAISSSDKSQHKKQYDDWGWWKNVDFTNNPSKVRWSNFLNDSRYADQGLGVFEGGLTYWSGVWRPTENSIMRYNTGGFNAPSRESIYYRINKLAYGKSWEYDYEEFVKADLVARSAGTAAAHHRRAANYVEKTYDPSTPPVVVGKHWSEEL